MGEGHKPIDAAGSAPRTLSDAERNTLIAALGYADFVGRDALLEQLDIARVVGGCGCGCATVDLAVVGAPPRDDSVSLPIPNEATVLNEDGEPIGGVLVFVRDGYLAQLEVYSFARETINPFPPADRLALTSVSR